MSELTDLYDRFFAFMIDQCDKRSKAQGFSMMYDVTDAGLSNVEMVSSLFHLTAGLLEQLSPSLLANHSVT